MLVKNERKPKCLVIDTGIKTMLFLQSIEYLIAIENYGDFVVVGITDISRESNEGTGSSSPLACQSMIRC